MWQQLCSLWSLLNKRPGGVLSMKLSEWTCSPQTERRQSPEFTHTYTNTQKYSHGEEEGVQPKTLLPEDKGMHLKPIITYAHTTKNPKSLSIHYTTFFPSNWIRSRSQNIKLFLNHFTSQLFVFLCVSSAC